MSDRSRSPSTKIDYKKMNDGGLEDGESEISEVYTGAYAMRAEAKEPETIETIPHSAIECDKVEQALDKELGGLKLERQKIERARVIIAKRREVQRLKEHVSRAADKLMHASRSCQGCLVCTACNGLPEKQSKCPLCRRANEKMDSMQRYILCGVDKSKPEIIEQFLQDMDGNLLVKKSGSRIPIVLGVPSHLHIGAALLTSTEEVKREIIAGKATFRDENKHWCRLNISDKTIQRDVAKLLVSEPHYLIKYSDLEETYSPVVLPDLPLPVELPAWTDRGMMPGQHFQRVVPVFEVSDFETVLSEHSKQSLVAVLLDKDGYPIVTDSKYVTGPEKRQNIVYEGESLLVEVLKQSDHRGELETFVAEWHDSERGRKVEVERTRRGDGSTGGYLDI